MVEISDSIWGIQKIPSMPLTPIERALSQESHNYKRKGVCMRLLLIRKDLMIIKTHHNPNDITSIDLVPAIAGGGPIAAAVTWLVGGTLLANITLAVIFAAISYALTPAPDTEQVEGTAGASKSSMIFGNTVNTATQGAPLPLGYGRLKVGSQVIQATIKSYPQNQRTDEILKGEGDVGFITNQMQS